VLTD